MKAVILAAGQGRRLLPLTAELPKALLDIAGTPLIERQIAAFACAGIREFVVVTGYAAERMDTALGQISGRMGVDIATVFNPFYGVADNLASCWMARHVMTGDVIQVNGDNVFRADLVTRLLSAPPAEVTVAINHKPAYDSDDMKVTLDGARLIAIGKTLNPDAVDAEAIGFYRFDAQGARAYVDVLDAAMRDPGALRQWFPSAIFTLSTRLPVMTQAMDGIAWCEVDVPADLDQANQLASRGF